MLPGLNFPTPVPLPEGYRPTPLMRLNNFDASAFVTPDAYRHRCCRSRSLSHVDVRQRVSVQLGFRAFDDLALDHRAMCAGLLARNRVELGVGELFGLQAMLMVD